MTFAFTMVGITISSTALFHNAFAGPEQKAFLILDYVHFMPLQYAGNQLIVILNYTTHDPSIIGQMINAVMRVYAPDGTLIKTSSFPSGFSANNSGTTRLATTLTGYDIQNVKINVKLTNAAKKETISNELTTGVWLGQSICPVC